MAKITNHVSNKSKEERERIFIHISVRKDN